ncbi:hypothetical protein PGT21_032578 [Puccinia graminis f. sp. tritici]|uniref:Uncharacterized protein n=1 Tax=Puccinia graminis f. sp. tritici TaxID=56615 RepID=A0A5B0LLU1_PUCGR|nr:hypothetical protein PGTUg99_001062 [Puccinia graminis f. sp. tritici]KAA1094910.1 hypothetical protein PGT21_032578 [Puccinia graminis f. sp. tritici]
MALTEEAFSRDIVGRSPDSKTATIRTAFSRPAMMMTDSLCSSSTYSIESAGDPNRPDCQTQPELQSSRQRSVTIDSTTGSSVETVTGLRLMVLDEHHHLVTQPEESASSSTRARNAASGCHTLGISQQHSAPASTRASPLPHLPVKIGQEANRVPASPSSCYSTDSSMLSESRGGHPRRKAVPASRIERPMSISRTASIESLSPLEIRPRLTHHSPPPWSMAAGLVEPCADELADSSRPDGGQTQTIEPISPNHPFPHQPAHQLKPSQKRSSTGLGKLFKSVIKSSLRSIPGTGSHLDLSSSHTTSTHTIHHHHHHQGNQQGWPSSGQAKSNSLKSVDVDCRTALADEQSDPLDITLMTHHREESNKPLSPRSQSSCSNSTIDSITTSTSHSASITPSSSLSSLPAIGSDCRNTKIPGWRQHDLNGHGSTDPNEPLPPLINTPDTAQHHSSSNSNSPNMSTQTAYNHSPPPANCFGNSYSSNNLHGRRDHPKLKLKASFGFLHNLKRAVGGVDHSLSFSFHNNSTTFLTTNTISLPFGTVLRNNGLDPLPHCHPLPLKPSQSSPSSLNYPSSLPPRLQQAEHFLQPGQRLASSASNPDFFDEQQYDRSPAPDQNFSIPPPNEAHRRTDEDSSHPLSRHHREIDNTLHPPKSPSIVPDDAPTLNLRPVSIPFAAGFSDRLLLADLNAVEPSAETRKVLNGRKKQRQASDHQDHCSCCSSLASENEALKNRIRELELHIYRSHTSKSKPAQE